MAYRPVVRLYQLRSLAANVRNYTLVDLDGSVEGLLREIPALAAVFSNRVTDSGRAFADQPVDTVVRHLEQLGVRPEQPLILVSESGRSAEPWQDRLENAGWTNVFVLEDGIVGLRADLERE
jgi:hypothetical protein